MPLMECNECKHQVASTAEACPNCGAKAPGGIRGRQIAGLVYLALVVLAFVWIWGLLTPPEAKTLQVSQAELGDAWPLTIDQGELSCDGASWVLFKADGEVYAVNGSARGHAKTTGWLDVESIWREDPQSPGFKVLMTPLIERGLPLCKG